MLPPQNSVHTSRCYGRCRKGKLRMFERPQHNFLNTCLLVSSSEENTQTNTNAQTNTHAHTNTHTHKHTYRGKTSHTKGTVVSCDARDGYKMQQHFVVTHLQVPEIRAVPLCEIPCFRNRNERVPKHQLAGSVRLNVALNNEGHPDGAWCYFQRDLCRRSI